MVSLAVPVKDGVVSLEGDFGAFNVTLGAAVSTVKVSGSLAPAGFSSGLSCIAIAVYCPLDRAGLASPELQSPPLPVAVALETIEPFAVDPAYISIVTGVVSLAKPAKDGVVSFDSGVVCLSVTTGEAVLIVNVTGGSLTPVGFPSSELSWVATAVYSPLESAGLALPEPQSPPLLVAVAVETTEPVAVGPA